MTQQTIGLFLKTQRKMAEQETYQLACMREDLEHVADSSRELKKGDGIPDKRVPFKTRISAICDAAVCQPTNQKRHSCNLPFVG
ncbi:uncharacterized protein LOC143246104 isoform X3 [Tachypleus tridentatus]|uniref:uncharacterized protein LOC143246104 isoform X3 n=1 Tax=Tachypleus tridentatus TaxID=6853 RepID=UPI003FCF848D